MALYVKLFNGKQWAVAKNALINAGLLKGTPEKTSVTQDFVNQLQGAFPEVYQNIKDTITIYQSKDMSGGEKAVAVAKEVLETAPYVITAIPNVRSVMVSAVTTIFADQFSGLTSKALEAVFKK